MLSRHRHPPPWPCSRATRCWSCMAPTWARLKASHSRSPRMAQPEAWHGPVWDAWARALSLAPHVVEPLPQGPRYEVDVVAVQPVNPVAAAYGAAVLTIRENRELQRQSGPHPSERSTRHIEVALSE